MLDIEVFKQELEAIVVRCYDVVDLEVLHLEILRREDLPKSLGVVLASSLCELLRFGTSDHDFASPKNECRGLHINGRSIPIPHYHSCKPLRVVLTVTRIEGNSAQV